MPVGRSHIKQAAIYVAGLVVAIVIVSPIGEFFISLAEEYRWYEHPSQRLAKMMDVLGFVGANPWFHWIGGGIIGFAVGVWLDAVLKRRDETRAPGTLTKPEVSVTETSERLFLGDNITPRYLVSFFEEHTSVQADKLMEAYIGKWMQLDGSLEEIVLINHSLANVTFNKGEYDPQYWRQHPNVFMYFRDPPWIDRLTFRKRGDKLTVIGQIKKIDAISVHLDNCELRDPPAAPPPSPAPPASPEKK